MRRRRLSNRSGQALVEFALTVPILLLLVVGIIEFGRLMSAYQTVTDTAREATRRMVVADEPCSEAKKDKIIGIIHGRLAAAGLDSTALRPTPSITCPEEQSVPDLERTTVELTYAYYMGWLGPLMGWTTGKQTVSLRTETHMRQE